MFTSGCVHDELFTKEQVVLVQRLFSSSAHVNRFLEEERICWLNLPLRSKFTVSLLIQRRQTKVIDLTGSISMSFDLIDSQPRNFYPLLGTLNLILKQRKDSVMTQRRKYGYTPEVSPKRINSGRLFIEPRSERSLVNFRTCGNNWDYGQRPEIVDGFLMGGLGLFSK